MQWEIQRVADFLELLPYDSLAASRLAKRHDHRVTGRASMVVHENRPLRHALEFRHAHFLTEEMVRLCRRHGVALVVAHSGEAWPCTEELTTDFVYVRLHGSPRTYQSSYRPAQLEHWAQRVRTWRDGGEPADARRITDRKPTRHRQRDVYVYFDNDQQAHAPDDARGLMRRLGVTAAGDREAQGGRPAS
jgi:uncharacterized protein YecE (DUF72 family)